MSLDISELQKAERNEVRVNGMVVQHLWHGEAYGVSTSHQTTDLEAEFWVSPIRTMRQKGVALVDSSGQMVKNERRDR